MELIQFVLSIKFAIVDIYFWDTSALAKHYFQEVGTVNARLWLANISLQHWITRITLAEISSAIVRRMPPADSTRYLAQFDTDVRSLQIGSLDDGLVTDAIRLTRQHHLRGCDSLQLAAAYRLANAIVQWNVSQHSIDRFYFVCSDDDLNRAAQAEGLVVMNPAQP